MRSPLLVPAISMILVGCTSSSVSTPAQFADSDIHTTARWAGQLTSSLNSVPPNSNRLARNTEIKSRIDAAMKEASTIVGKQVSWGMQCGVSEAVITILPNQFGLDGQTLIHDSNRIALMVLDDRPMKTEYGTPTRDVDPKHWFFQLDVPEHISTDIAATLPENVVVIGQISKVEIERFRDRELDPIRQSDDDEWYLLYVYLTDVTLQPASGG